MDTVTVGFGKYDLSDICQEYKKYASKQEINEVLPPQACGSKVHLLFGIRSVYLDPVLVKVRSPFTASSIHHIHALYDPDVMMEESYIKSRVSSKQLPGFETSTGALLDSNLVELGAQPA